MSGGGATAKGCCTTLGPDLANSGEPRDAKCRGDELAEKDVASGSRGAVPIDNLSGVVGRFHEAVNSARDPND